MSRPGSYRSGNRLRFDSELNAAREWFPFPEPLDDVHVMYVVHPDESAMHVAQDHTQFGMSERWPRFCHCQTYAQAT